MAKKILIALITILTLSSFGGYFYFKNMFKAPPNLITVNGSSTEVDITWTNSENSDRAGMFVPVKIKGLPENLYMQFDMGAVYSLLYNKPLSDLAEKYNIQANTNFIESFEVELNEMTVHFDSIKNINYGKPINWDDKEKKIIIGTLGADFLERVKSVINFKESKLSFYQTTPDLVNGKDLHDFQFEERRIMIDMALDGETKTLMWDTGASAYNLITSESNYNTLASKPLNEQVEDANQLKRKLKVYTAASDKKFILGDQSLDIKSVTYVDGFPWYIKVMYYFSPMEGMVGNNLFRDKSIYIDPANEKFLLL